MKRLIVFLLASIPFMGVLGEGTHVETRKKIVVIDGQIDISQLYKRYMCYDGSKSLDSSFPSSYNLTLRTGASVHGMNIVGLVGNGIDPTKYCIYHLASYSEDTSKIAINSFKGLKLVSTLTNVVGLNLSEQSENDPRAFSLEELNSIREITHKGIKVVVSAGNSGEYLTRNNCNVYPACLQLRLPSEDKGNMFVIGSSTYMFDKYGNPKVFTNLSHDLLLSFEDGFQKGTPSFTGTSQAAAIFTGKLFSK